MNIKHWLIMIIGCLLPLIGIVAIYFFKVPISSALVFALILFCPFSHMIMMGQMAHNHSDENHGAQKYLESEKHE